MIDRDDREAVQDAMTHYVLGELGQEEEADLERLLAADPALAAEADSLRRALDLMPYAAAAEPPAVLHSSVLAAAEAALRGRTGPHRRPQWSRWLSAAAVLAALVLAWDRGRLRRELSLHQQVTTTLTQPNILHFFTLTGREALPRSFGRVVLDLDAKKAAVVIHHLPPLPAGEVYRLWALVGETEVPCGHFDAGEEGTVLRQLPIPVDAYTEPVSRLILTRETSLEASRPRGPTVMVGTAVATS